MRAQADRAHDEMQLQALALRRAGVTLSDIATILGYAGKASVHKVVQRVRDADRAYDPKDFDPRAYP